MPLIYLVFRQVVLSFLPKTRVLFVMNEVMTSLVKQKPSQWNAGDYTHSITPKNLLEAWPGVLIMFWSDLSSCPSSSSLT